MYGVMLRRVSMYYDNDYYNYTHHYAYTLFVPSSMDKPSVMRILAFAISSSSKGRLPGATPNSIASCAFTHRPSRIFKPCTNFRRPCLNSGTARGWTTGTSGLGGGGDGLPEFRNIVLQNSRENDQKSEKFLRDPAGSVHVFYKTCTIF